MIWLKTIPAHPRSPNVHTRTSNTPTIPTTMSTRSRYANRSVDNTNTTANGPMITKLSDIDRDSSVVTNPWPNTMASSFERSSAIARTANCPSMVRAVRVAPLEVSTAVCWVITIIRASADPVPGSYPFGSSWSPNCPSGLDVSAPNRSPARVATSSSDIDSNCWICSVTVGSGGDARSAAVSFSNCSKSDTRRSRRSVISDRRSARAVARRSTAANSARRTPRLPFRTAARMPAPSRRDRFAYVASSTSPAAYEAFSRSSWRCRDRTRSKARSNAAVCESFSCSVAERRTDWRRERICRRSVSLASASCRCRVCAVVSDPTSVLAVRFSSSPRALSRSASARSVSMSAARESLRSRSRSARSVNSSRRSRRTAARARTFEIPLMESPSANVSLTVSLFRRLRWYRSVRSDDSRDRALPSPARVTTNSSVVRLSPSPNSSVTKSCFSTAAESVSADPNEVDCSTCAFPAPTTTVPINNRTITNRRRSVTTSGIRSIQLI